jgi:hypothetical protein
MRVDENKIMFYENPVRPSEKATAIALLEAFGF